MRWIVSVSLLVPIFVCLGLPVRAQFYSNERYSYGGRDSTVDALGRDSLGRTNFDSTVEYLQRRSEEERERREREERKRRLRENFISIGPEQLFDLPHSRPLNQPGR